MKIQQLYTNCLAQGAYYIAHKGEAVIIDPLRETKPYLDLLAANKDQLKYVFETHFHADFVSGHVDLALETGANSRPGQLAPRLGRRGRQFGIALHTKKREPRS